MTVTPAQAKTYLASLLCWLALTTLALAQGVVPNGVAQGSIMSTYNGGYNWIDSCASGVLTFSSAKQPSCSTTLPAGLTIGAGTLANGTSATTQAVPDNSTNLATDQFVNNSLLRFISTLPLNLGAGAGGTYSFNSQGSGVRLLLAISGGVITSVNSVVTPGTGYAVGDILDFTTGNNDNAILVTGVSSGGVTTAQVLYGGTGNGTGPFNAPVGVISAALARNILLSGTLTSDASIIGPGGNYLTASGFFFISNNTTGSYTTTVCAGANGSDACAGGRTVTLPQGTNNSTSTLIYVDGSTNADAYPGNLPSPIHIGGQTGITKTCSAMPTAMTITGGVITSITGGTCS